MSLHLFCVIWSSPGSDDELSSGLFEVGTAAAASSSESSMITIGSAIVFLGHTKMSCFFYSFNTMQPYFNTKTIQA